MGRPRSVWKGVTFKWPLPNKQRRPGVHGYLHEYYAKIRVTIFEPEAVKTREVEVSFDSRNERSLKAAEDLRDFLVEYCQLARAYRSKEGIPDEVPDDDTVETDTDPDRVQGEAD